jgi:hypothetical protein
VVDRVALMAAGADHKLACAANAPQFLQIVVVTVQDYAGASSDRPPQRVDIWLVSVCAGAVARTVPERDPTVTSATQLAREPPKLWRPGL